MSFAHFIACSGFGMTLPLSDGYSTIRKLLLTERIVYIYNCGFILTNEKYLLYQAAILSL